MVVAVDLKSGLGMLVLFYVFFAGLAVGLWVLAPLTGSYYVGVTEEDSAWRSEKIRVVGSTTVLPIANATAIAFMNKYRDLPLSITVEGGGSGRGYAELIDGLCDIASASREPKPEEIAKAQERGVSLVLHVIAIDAICIVVNPNVTKGLGGTLNLTLRQVGEIFSGKYSTWHDFDPRLPKEKIVIIVREAGSGTREIFEEKCIKPFNFTVSEEAMNVVSNMQMLEQVKKTPYSIGFLGLGYVTPDVRVVNIGEKEGGPYYAPTPENVYAGKYPLSRNLYFVTNGWPKSGSLVDRYIDFVEGLEGQRIVEKVGYLPLPYYYFLEKHNMTSSATMEKEVEVMLYTTTCGCAFSPISGGILLFTYLISIAEIRCVCPDVFLVR